MGIGVWDHNESMNFFLLFHTDEEYLLPLVS